MARVRVFASAREAAGTSGDAFDGDTVDDVLARAVAAWGDAFAAILPTCRVWVNGLEADGTTPVGADDEVAVLPPVSGG
jgi:molybdopterin converting factor small subunit